MPTAGSASKNTRRDLLRCHKGRGRIGNKEPRTSGGGGICLLQKRSYKVVTALNLGGLQLRRGDFFVEQCL